MAAAAQVPSILELDLGENGGKFRFASVADVDAWLQREIQNANWVREARDEHINNAFQRYWGPLNEMSQFVQQAKTAQDRKSDTDLNNQLAAFKSRAEEFFKKKPRHSSLPRSKFLDHLRETRGSSTAAFAFVFLENESVVPRHAQAFEGVFEGFLFSRGLLESGAKKRSTAQAAAFDELLKTSKGAHDEHQASMQALRSALEATIADGTAKIQEQGTQHSTLVAAHNQALTESIAAGDKKLDAIAAAYDAHMALQAPVTYWEGQRDHHRRMAIGFAIGTSAWVILGLVGLYVLANLLMSSAETVTVGGYPIPKVPFWHIAYAAVALTIYFWATRILVRILISQIHLNTDAAERVVMAKTYIALLRDAKGPKDEDRQLILQTLFRPSATGMVKDDAIPPTVLEWMTRLHGK